MRKILYLPTETTARELDARLLLAHRALSRGYFVVIGRRRYAKQEAEKIGCGIYLDKGHNVNRVFPFNGQSSNFCKAAIDEEGLVFLSDGWFVIRSKPNVLEGADIIFTWGKYQRDILVKENNKLKEKIIPVGNPRFDLLRPEYSKMHLSSDPGKKYGLKKYILINTNFTPGNLNPNYKKDYIELLNQFGRIKTEFDLNFWQSRKGYYRRLINAYKEMVIKLSEKFSDIDFVLRPHPSEDIMSWKKAFKGYSNIKVIFKDSVVPWIYNSIAVIHTGCTTGIESWALNKPVFRYNPEPESIYEPALPNKFGHSCFSIGQLENLIDLCLEKKITGNFREQISIIKTYLESIDDSELSAEKMLDAFDDFYVKRKIDKPKNYSVSDFTKRLDTLPNRFKFTFLSFLKQIKVTEIPLLNKIFSFLISQNFQKFSGISKSMIINRLSRFDEVHKEHFSNHRIKKIASDTYIIFPVNK